MKKTMIAGGIAALAFVAFPASVHADSYTDNMAAPSETTSWNQDRCDRIDNRLYNLNTMFNQENSGLVARQQRLIDRQNNAECPIEGTIVDNLAKNSNFSTLVTAVQAAGLVDTLSVPGELTVFAPTNQAFEKLPAGTLEALLADKAMLTTVLTNHVVSGKVDADTAVDVGEAKSFAGNTLNIGYGDDGVLYVNDARLLVTDIQTCNGVIHVIDSVLVP